MESTLLKKDALTETYYDMENLINDTVWRFCNRYGGDFEEWKAEANLTFVRAFNTHKRSKAQFSTWLRFCVWKRLLDYYTALQKQSPKTIRIERDLSLENFESKKRYSFSSLELLDGLQEDTKTLINLIWNLPHDLPISNGDSPCHTKIALKNYLRDAGWTLKRIKESFEEITRVINDY